MRHPDDLPDAIGWTIALLCGAIGWGLFYFLLSPPWSHVVGAGSAMLAIVAVLRWWHALNRPNR